MAGSVKDCCKQPDNLVHSQPKPDLKLATCSVCGARHFRLQADRGSLGAMLRELGK